LIGRSIWDGPKIARHAADVDEDPHNLEDSFLTEESFEQDEDDVKGSSTP